MSNVHGQCEQVNILCLEPLSAAIGGPVIDDGDGHILRAKPPDSGDGVAENVSGVPVHDDDRLTATKIADVAACSHPSSLDSEVPWAMEGHVI